VSSSPRRRPLVHSVACQLPTHRVDRNHILKCCHLFRSNDDRNEVWTSPSDWNEFALRSNVVGRCRVYAVSGKSKLPCSPLFLLFIMQTLVGVVVSTIFLRLPSGSFYACSLISADGHPDQPVPEEILDLFRLCTYTLWLPGSFITLSITLAFGALSPSNFRLRC
jgi:hypothetical protein